MRFTPQFLDELKARLPVSEVVGKRVKLIRSGREFKGLSPFNKEKTPSFFVNDQKEAWFDFSSGKNGSIFDFIMLTEGVAFPEAVERLAQMAGVPLPKVSPEEQQRDAHAKTLYDVMELAAKFFEATLASRLGAKARGYLADRGLDAGDAIEVPPRLFAGRTLRARRNISARTAFRSSDMIEAGLLIAGDDIPVPFDRFRDRVMFPITDIRGRVIAFGGRALEKDVPAKYLNSPETPLFHKGHTLYNIATARQAVHDGAKTGVQLIVVEGYVDVIAMVTAGFPATVAPLGTALTEDQLGAAVENGRRAGAVFRRRWRRRARRLSRRRSGDAAPEARQEPEIRAAAVRARTRTICCARPAATRSTMSSPPPSRWRRCCGRARPKAIPSTRRSGARRWKRASTKSPPRSATKSVRKYYRQDFNDRLRQFFAPAQGQGFGFGGRGAFVPRAAQWLARATGATGSGRWQRRARLRRKRPEVGSRNTPYVVVSQQMAAARCIAATAPRCRPARR